ncbi:MAG: thioredoxin-disulfide reductase [Myxococcales bacterium]|nr:thioredoxin-disulfide reductase [Myxococcales bacterium]MCB9643369.1 thioredoxin-disulfide reductase [Myxococcales bacterium]
MTEQATHKRVVILGSGPAGLTAAIYAARADLAPLVIDGMEPGGQLTTTTDVENYPGFPDGVMGPEMMDMFRRQAERFGTEFLFGSVTKVDFSARPLKMWIDDSQEMTTDALIISTGASAKWLGLPSESAYRGFGVSSCATCDGSFFKNEVMVVVGGGDTALEEALYLSRLGSKVYVVHRRGELRASKIMQDRAFANPKIEFVWNAALDEILGEGQGHMKKVTGVRLRDTQTDETKELACGAVFVAIGHQPNTSLFEGQLEMHHGGYLVVEPGSTRTNIAGVFAAGDVADHSYRQAVTAAGSGCMAAIDVERYLGELEG